MSMGHTSVEKCSILPQIKLDLDVITINLHTKFYFNSASSANKLNRNCWWTVQPSPTNRRTAAKQYALPSLKGGIKMYIIIINSQSTTLYDTKLFFQKHLAESCLTVHKKYVAVSFRAA